MEDKKIDLIVENEKEQQFLIQVPSTIKYKDLREILKEKIFKKYNFDTIHRNKKYTKKDLDAILNIIPGEKLYTIGSLNLESCSECHFHKNLNLEEADMKTEELSGILHLCLLKYIAKNIEDLTKIQNNEIRDIIKELKEGIELKDNPQENIKESLSQKNGNNILAYVNYLNEIINLNRVNELISLVAQNKKKEIIEFWSILSKYQDFNILFEKDFSKMIENSYLDYSLIAVAIYQHKRRKEFVEKLNKCPNCEVRYLLHGTQIEPISLIMTGEFKYTKKAFYGMGIYFSDMIDYISFYCGGDSFNTRRENWAKILPVNNTISCIAAEVFYNKDLKKYIYDNKYSVKTLKDFPTYEEIKKNYKDKMVEKNGIHFIRVEPTHGHVIKKEENVEEALKKGNFIGNEYVITEMEQILPLYGLTLKRNEYFVIWRDPSFKEENQWTKYLKPRKMFIYKEAKMNAFFVGSIEKALEIINRKKYNKIILISSIGLDLSGKKFVDIARKILKFDVMVLFFSSNKKHLKWIKNYPNALYTNNSTFYEKYIKNYNEEGLKNLKCEIEKNYNIQLKFTQNFLEFPIYINEERYDKVIFEEKSDNFKKVMIKNNQKALFMEKGKVSFASFEGVDIKPFIWYVTIDEKDNKREITLFSNGYYLDADTNEKIVKGFEYMKIWYYNENKGQIYYDNTDNTLTIDGNKALIQKENNNYNNQLFELTNI